MFSKLSLLRGLHPGIFLDRELSKRALKKGSFAISIGEYPQTLGAVMLGKRKMNPPLARKIEKSLGWEDGFLMCLQALHDMKAIDHNMHAEQPDLSVFRPVLFWDTDLQKMNWQKSRLSVIKRVSERGNEMEKKEIERFYKVAL